MNSEIPSSTFIEGLNPIKFSSSEQSAQVACTSPYCISIKFFFIFKSSFFSIAWIKSFSLTLVEFPIFIILYGEKKYPDRPNCQEIVTEHQDLKYKCTGRQTHGYAEIRQLFKRLNINFDLYNADVIIEQYSEDTVDPRGIELTEFG